MCQQQTINQMKKILATIFIIIMILTVAGVVFAPQQAEASFLDLLLCAGGVGKCTNVGVDWFMSFVAEAGNAVLWMTSWFLTLAGLLLNISIVLTMNIKAIYQATPAIDQVWIVIRNISSIFIIFGLLYSSIMTILDMGKPNVKALIGKIILAGLLINFSLFFTKIAIDASNLISLQFYRAIAPDSSASLISGKMDGREMVKSAYLDGGISNIFQQSLKIPAIYSNKKGLISGGNNSTFFTIAVSTFAGSTLMIFAALSFLAASIAFIIRIVVLLLLMGFSPIYFVGMIFPEVESNISKKWERWLVSELLFMPAYLLFMYVAMSFISSGNGTSFFDALDEGRRALGGEETGGVLLSTVGLLLQYSIAFILINVPLIAALQLGGTGMKWGDSAKKWVSGKLKNTAVLARQNTLGRAASKLAENESLKNYAAKSMLGGIALKGLRGQATSYNKKLDEQVSERTKFGESLGHDQGQMNVSQAYLRNLNAQLAQAQSAGLPTSNIKTAIGNVKRSITDLENRRRGDYVARINSRSPETLYTKIARKDKVAAAKLQISIVEDQIKHHKDDLKNAKDEMKQIQQAIMNNPAGTGTITIPGVNGLATPAQQARYQQLLGDQVNYTNDINNQEVLLDNLKLVK